MASKSCGRRTLVPRDRFGLAIYLEGPLSQLASHVLVTHSINQLLGGTRVRGRSSRSFFDGVSMWQALEVASSGAAASTAASAVCISPCTYRGALRALPIIT